MKVNQQFVAFEVLTQLQPFTPPFIPYYRPEFFETIKKHSPNPKVVVELGSLTGEWAYEMLSRFPSIEGLFCVDLWEDGEGRPAPCVAGRRQFQSWLKRMEPWLYKKVFPCRGTTDFWAKMFPYEIDVLYIDANHSYDAAKNDALKWIPLVRDGGLVIGHDYERPHVKKAIKDALLYLVGKDIDPNFLVAGPAHVQSFLWLKEQIRNLASGEGRE